MEPIRIDLGIYKNQKSTVFTGRPQGESVREKLDLEKEDTLNRKVIFIIPGDTNAFNPSFYLGLLFKSYKKLKLEKFEEKYSFEIDSDNATVVKLLNNDLDDGRRSAINSLEASSSIFDSFFKK